MTCGVNSLVLAAEGRVESDATAVEVTVAGRGRDQITMTTRMVVGGAIEGGVLCTKMTRTVVGGAIGGGVPCIMMTRMEVGVATGGGALYTKTIRMVVGVVEGGGVPYLKTKAEREEMTIMTGARREVGREVSDE